MRSFHFLLLTFFLFFGKSQGAVLLRNQGGGSLFRVKTVSASTRLEKGLALTTLVWTFADQENHWKPEVEFVYSAPPRSVVTFFAYWYGGERVVARVVEKERAASIYSQLSEWGRDPALIEFEGDNTFRARIFPVAAGQDVRIEMHIVQPLEATATGLQWRLPLQQPHVPARQLSKWLKPEESPRPRYDQVQVNVDASAIAGDSFTSNVAGLDWQNKKGRWRAKNWDADRDLLVTIPRSKSPLYSDLYSSRSSRENGYFSLLLVPNQALSSPHFSIEGVKTFDIFPRNISSLRAGQSLVVSGRYQGAGRATVHLGNLKTNVNFTRLQGANNPAAKLWASQRINFLGWDEMHRAQVIALSKRWMLPSAQTSWLAVPTVEKVNFERTKAQARKEQTLRNVISQLMINKDVQAQKARLSRYDHYEIGSAMQALGLQIARAHELEQARSSPNVRQLTQLERQLDTLVLLQKKLNVRDSLSDRDTYLDQARQNLAYDQGYVLAQSYVDAYLRYGKSSPEAMRASNEMSRFGKALNQEAYLKYIMRMCFYNETRESLHKLAYELMREKARLNHSPDAEKIQGIEADMKRLATISGYSQRISEFLAWQREYAKRDTMKETLDAYRAELEKAVPDTTTLQNLRERTSLIRQNKIITEQSPWGGNYQNEVPDPLGTEFKAAESTSLTVAQKQELLIKLDQQRALYARPGDPLIAVQAPSDCLQVVALFPNGDIKKLEWNASNKRFECHFDVPAYASEGAYTVRIVLVDRQGQRRQLQMTFHVDLTAPDGKAKFLTSTGQTRLRFEGDQNTDRVSAFTSWNTRLELRRTHANMFESPIQIPGEWRDRSAAVRFVVTDKAHNRTEVSLDLSP